MSMSSAGYEFSAWLASAGIPPSRLRQLLDAYHSSEECYHAFQRKDPFFIQTLSPRIIELLNRNGDAEGIRKYKQVMDELGIRVFLYYDKIYPEKLKQTSDPPVILFYQGKTECMNGRVLAVVGSRAASYNGQKATKKLTHDLSTHGITVVSGMASGIDSFAHEGCIEGGSPTIAVTGCGLDIIYPASNKDLRDTIIRSGGLILSEYAPGEKPAGWHFPVRNRIITGIAEALILMEAKIRSGSMTSVQHALEQGKDVFVYPGDPMSEYFEGNHQLLREGGIYFTSAENILEDLHWLDNPFHVRQNSGCSAESPQMTTDEIKIVNALKPGILGFEKLVSLSGLEPSRLMSALTMLQIRGTIEALPGKQYQLKA